MIDKEEIKEIKEQSPFPQANDFEKIISILEIDRPDSLRNYSIMTKYLGDISDRQVDYYISACSYLGIIDRNKEFSRLGVYLRKLCGLEQKSELARIIVSDEVFGTVYFRQKMLGVELDKDEVVEIMKEHIEFESEAMYQRRASTVISWIKWILQQESL